MNFAALLAPVTLWYRLGAIAALAAALFGYGYFKGAEHGEAKLDAYVLASNNAVLVQATKAGVIAENLKKSAAAQKETLDAEIVRINAAYAASERLRRRAERRAVDPRNPTACHGANGSELARGDAGFLGREAAESAIQQAERNACIARYNEVAAELNALRRQAKPLQAP